MTTKFELLNQAEVLDIDSGIEYTNILKGVNKHYNKTLKGNSKARKNKLTEAVNEKTLEATSFFKTNTAEVSELVTVVENVEFLSDEYKGYKKEVLKEVLSIMNVENVDDLSDELTKEYNAISKHLDKLYQYAFSKAKRIKTKALSNLIDEINTQNDIKAVKNASYTVLGNKLTYKQLEGLNVAMFDSKGKNIENLYELIKKHCLANGDYPQNKLVVSFEKSFKHIPMLTQDIIDTMTYTEARKTLALYDIEALGKIEKRKSHTSDDIKKAIRKLVLEVDTEILEVLDNYKIEF